MVLATDIARATHETAATTAASIHLYHEGSVIETPLAGFTGVPGVSGVAVMAPEQGVVEWFPHPDQDLRRLAALAAETARTGWRIAVLVPSARMGEAHGALRGAPVTLQPWWVDGERVRFGGPEVP